MTKMVTSNVITTYYSDDQRLMSEVVDEDGRLFVFFYKDEILLDSREVADHSLSYAEDMAENYVSGVIKLDPNTWRLNGV